MALGHSRSASGPCRRSAFGRPDDPAEVVDPPHRPWRLVRNGGCGVVSLREAPCSTSTTRAITDSGADKNDSLTFFTRRPHTPLAAGFPPLRRCRTRSTSPACRGTSLRACHHAGCPNAVRSLDLDAEGAFTVDKSRSFLQPNSRQADFFHFGGEHSERDDARISGGGCKSANSLERPARLPESSWSRRRESRKGSASSGTAPSACLAAQRKRRLFRSERSRQVFTE